MQQQIVPETQGPRLTRWFNPLKATQRLTIVEGDAKRPQKTPYLVHPGNHVDIPSRFDQAVQTVVGGQFDAEHKTIVGGTAKGGMAPQLRKLGVLDGVTFIPLPEELRPTLDQALDGAAQEVEEAERKLVAAASRRLAIEQAQRSAADELAAAEKAVAQQNSKPAQQAEKPQPKPVESVETPHKK